MSRRESHSSRFFSVPKIRQQTMQTTHSFVNAHRQITPQSTRAVTEPAGGIDSTIIGIISSKSPHSHRVHKLLKLKGGQQRKRGSKAQVQLFNRVYDRQRKRMLSEVESAEQRKQRLRQKLGLSRKPNRCFFDLTKANLNYLQQKLPSPTVKNSYHTKLHAVCRLYEQYSQRVSLRPRCLENPFEGHS